MHLPDWTLLSAVVLAALALCIGVFMRVMNTLTGTDSDKQEQLVQTAYAVLQAAEEDEKEVTATIGCVLYVAFFVLLVLVGWAVIKYLIN